jgi:hypothetical protein
MEDQIVYRYVPRDGLFIIGVPQQDLTLADVMHIGPDLLARATATGLYVPTSVPEHETAAQRKAREKQEAEAAAAAEAERLAAIEAAGANDGESNAGDDDSGDAGEGNDA